LGLELDVINKGYAELLTSDPVPETSKEPFTEDEITRLWAIQGEPWVDSVLIFLYSGWRISELLGLKCADVDLDAGTMKGGVKTKAGKGRIVPIHSKIAEIVKRRYNEGGEYLLSYENGKQVSTSQYYILWNAVMKRIGAEHTVHETRHTFRSKLDSAGANKSAIDKIMGHSGGGTGEKVYTHKTIQELKDAIELID
jgi:integrase